MRNECRMRGMRAAWRRIKNPPHHLIDARDETAIPRYHPDSFHRMREVFGQSREIITISRNAASYLNLPETDRFFLCRSSGVNMNHASSEGIFQPADSSLLRACRIFIHHQRRYQIFYSPVTRMSNKNPKRRLLFLTPSL